MTPPATGLSIDDGYRALAGGRAGVRRSAEVAWVEGPDAASFLHGLLTQDITGLTAGETTPALLLDARGRIRVQMRVRRDGAEAFTLLLREGSGGRLVDALTDFHFSEDLDVLGPEPATLLTLAGVDRESAGALGDLVIDGEVPGTVDLLTEDPDAALTGLGAVSVPEGSLEVRRIEAGVPIVGIDTADTTLVQEAGLETLAVSFDKGCYLGQETVARIAHRGGVRRLLRGLSLDRAVRPGAAVLHEGREVGHATSVGVSPAHGPVALAILRTEAEPGDEVRVAGATAEVVELPFPGLP